MSLKLSHQRSLYSSPGGGKRWWRVPRIPIVIALLLFANIAVFFVQHLTLSGYQRLIPDGARSTAVQIAERLRRVDEPRLARSLEEKLNVIGEVERVADSIEDRATEREARLSILRSRNPSDEEDSFNLANEIAAEENRLRDLNQIGVDVNSLPSLLGSNHEAGGVSLQVLRDRRVWTLFTHLFVHGSIFHLALNMIVLAAAGSFAATCLGTRHFLALYFLGGLVGAALQISFFPNVYLIGASAGVYAITIAALLLLPEDSFYRFRIPLRPRFVAIGITVVALVLLTWTLVTEGSEVGFIVRVAHLAHLGGIMVGWYYVKMLGIGPREAAPRFFGSRMELHE